MTIAQKNKLIKKSYEIFDRSLTLQGDIRHLADELIASGFTDEAEDLNAGAFEMDSTWSNAEGVYRSLKRKFGMK